MIIPNEIVRTERGAAPLHWSGRLAAAASIAAFCLAGIACKESTNAFVAPPPPDVTVAHPITKSVTRYLEYTGTTEAFQSVDLRARVAGFLEQVNFKPGAAVKKGDLLFVIDKRTYQAAVERAEAQVLADEAASTAAESDARIAEELAAQRAGSEIDKLTKIGRRDSAKAAVVAAKAALVSAQLDLEFCEVHAPIDGRITKNFVDIGNLVGAGGQPTMLATLVKTNPLYVSVDSSEADVLMVRRTRMKETPGAEPGQSKPGEWRSVDLATADSNAFDVHGHIDYVDPGLNPQSGTIRVRAVFDNSNEVLLPGLFVRVRILLESADAMLVPDEALLSDQSGRYALVVDDKDKVEARHVKIGVLDGGLRVVTDGLSATDKIIVNGLQRARAGATVHAQLREIANDAAATPSAPAKSDAPTSAPAHPLPSGK